MTALALLILIWGLAALTMTLGWRWQRARHNAGIVDVLWAAGLLGSALLSALLGHGALWPRLMLALCGGLWGARLAHHLWRRVRAEPEDGRYRHLRGIWREDQRRWFALFQSQAALVVLFAVPFVIVANNPVTCRYCLVLAAAVWIASVSGEFLADRQLARFRADPLNRARTCRAGLWRYSRHPNYFFEWLHWFTYVALAIGAPGFGASLIGPVAMFALLRWVSGIPYTEAQVLRTRGEDYRSYQRSTSMLLPWPPKRTDPQEAGDG